MALAIVTKSSCFYAAEQTNRSIESTQQTYDNQYNVARYNPQPYRNQLHSVIDQLQANYAFLTEHDRNITLSLTPRSTGLIKSNILLSRIGRDSKVTGRSNEIINSLIPEIHEIQDTTQRALFLNLMATINVELDKYGNRHHK
ncbi:hypothetical protein [Candidatus Chromulinivorax destructor]|uniref:hypothetical protein n=1 Tax=Candidatus Chromulinivorax destructor TaxID=2066483 RepID=UPI0013B447B2|nr:hypothetical protein [Candidatus Chromulinivorax destructor]